MARSEGRPGVVDVDLPGATVPVALAAVARRHPDRTAVCTPDAAMTYAELVERSALFTQWLADTVPTSPDPSGTATPVAVLAGAGTASIAAALGVLASPHPLVLLDTQLPVARWQQILDACGARVCLVEPALVGAAAALTGPRCIPLEDVIPGHGGSASAPGTGAGAAPGPYDLATVVFTSGSTGAPKGVRHSQGHLVHEAALYADALRAHAGDRLALLVPPAFAMGETTLLAGLLSGAGVWAWDPRVRGVRDLASWLATEGVTRAVMTPSLLRAVADTRPAPGLLDDLAVLLLSGEAVTGKDVDVARSVLPDATVVNMFGSSETGAVASLVLAPGDVVPADPLPVGTPLPGKAVSIHPELLTQADTLADESSDGSSHESSQGGARRGARAGAGALQVAGRWLACGYLSPQSSGPPSSSPFITTASGVPAVLMGDVASVDDDGVVHVLGRRDDVVKVRGYLVHPAEVEAVLRRVDGVAEVVVTGSGPAAGARLVGYVVPAATRRTPAPAQLRRALRQALPDWMVPAELVMLDALPRTERGKVDRQALPRPQRPPLREPVTAWEHRIAALWREVLGRDDIGCDDVFTDLGGDSLTVEEFAARLGEEYGVNLTSSHVAEAPTVASLALLVGDLECSRGSARRHGSVVTLRRTGTRRPLFCFTGAGSSGQAFLPLARSLGDAWPVHAFQPHGLEELALPDLSVAQAARRHVRRLRELQPHGPYLLAGHSMGGVIALEAAHLLVAAGEVVDGVVLIDPALPSAMFRRVVDRPADGILPEPDQAATVVIPDFPRLTWGQKVIKSVRWASAYGHEVFRPSARRADLFFHLGDVTTSPHRPRPWTGRAVLYITEGYPGGAAAWGEVLLGPVHVDTLGGDHVSVLRAPHVHTVAADIVSLAAEVDAARVGGVCEARGELVAAALPEAVPVVARSA